MANITVVVQVGEYPGEHDIRLCTKLPMNLVYNAYVPIDMPAQNAPAFAALFCTPALEVKRVKVSRLIAAKQLSESLTEIILESMGYNDTVMGYPQEHK